MAKVRFKRINTASQIDNVPIQDGSFIVTGDGKSYIDYGLNRVPTNGTLDSEMSDDSLNGVENKVIKTYVDNAKQEAINYSKPIVLWENSSPTSSFSSQSISLSSSDYNYIEIYYYDWVTSSRRDIKCVKALKGYNINLDAVFQSTTESMMYLASRRVIYTDATHLSVTNVKGLNSQQLTVESINEICVPVKILGYK